MSLKLKLGTRDLSMQPLAHTHARTDLTGLSSTIQSLVVAADSTEVARLVLPDNTVAGFPAIIKTKTYTCDTPPVS